MMRRPITPSRSPRTTPRTGYPLDSPSLQPTKPHAAQRRRTKRAAPAMLSSSARCGHDLRPWRAVELRAERLAGGALDGLGDLEHPQRVLAQELGPHMVAERHVGHVTELALQREPGRE